jgi:hypothetical protein
MALANYTDLHDALEDYLLRDDRIEDFIRLAEVRAEREINLRQRWTELETKGLQMIPDQDYIDMPVGMLEPRWIRINTNPSTFLRVMGPEKFDVYRNEQPPGLPIAIMARGLQLALSPTPDSDYTYDINGYYGITPLTPSKPTNWLLTNAPDVYLYGALREAQPYLRKPERLAMYQELSRQALRSLKRQENRARLGGGRLRMRPDIRTP